jgi:hypothetical protein
MPELLSRFSNRKLLTTLFVLADLRCGLVSQDSTNNSTFSTSGCISNKLSEICEGSH